MTKRELLCAISGAADETEVYVSAQNGVAAPALVVDCDPDEEGNPMICIIVAQGAFDDDEEAASE